MGEEIVGQLHHDDAELGAADLAERQLLRQARRGAPSLSRMALVSYTDVVVRYNHIISSA